MKKSDRNKNSRELKQNSAENIPLINQEIFSHGDHSFHEIFAGKSTEEILSFFDYNDFSHLLQMVNTGSQTARLYSLDKLLERDKLREKDGFPRKIKLGKLVKPAKDGNDKTIIIPTVSEEKFYHWKNPQGGEGGSTGGTGDAQEGEVIGEEPLRTEDGAGQGAGQGKGGEHGMGTDAYDLGRILTEQFELPNIKEKGKRTSLTKFTYDLTDKHRGHGQILDKKSTLKKVVKTNLALGYLKSDNIDTSKILISPEDKIYRTFSKERDYESKAIVFFIRDYSGSMSGRPTEVVVSQHIYINSWLVYQYKRQVINRFIVHDTEAEEVPDFYTYYNKQVAGGTDVYSAYKLVNEIIEEENLAKEYNIYVFQGTDGDDWDTTGEKVLPELEKIIHYASRVGITIASNSPSGSTSVEKYINKSKFLETFSKKLRMDVILAAEANEERIIKGIKHLISN